MPQVGFAHDSSVWASEDNSCVRPCGHYDRRCSKVTTFQFSSRISEVSSHTVLNQNYCSDLEREALDKSSGLC
jgi:hypothetical protein